MVQELTYCRFWMRIKESIFPAVRGAVLEARALGDPTDWACEGGRARGRRLGGWRRVGMVMARKRVRGFGGEVGHPNCGCG